VFKENHGGKIVGKLLDAWGGAIANLNDRGGAGSGPLSRGYGAEKQAPDMRGKGGQKLSLSCAYSQLNNY